jgi:hypothetical protein
MKTQKLNQPAKKSISGILLITFMFFIASCSTSESFLNSSVVPSATGKVKIKKDNNQNYTVKIEIDDLAEVERLQTSKQTYIVWMETEKGNTENLGQLKSTTGFMSKQHTASLEATSPFKPVRIFVTAENESNARYPDRDLILTTDTFYTK